ncbi:MAG TPA: ferredoxin reductase, partial [Alphaproteobacteria bacterium]|nr:ferredoxin reductase [Alphaproteobacteria bacterium]
GVLTVNQPKDMAHGRRMIMRHLRPDPAALADPGSDLRQIIKAAS